MSALTKATRITPPRTMEDFPAFVSRVNAELTKLTQRVDEFVTAPKFRGDIDLGGHRVTNVGQTKGPHDVPNRKELTDKGLFDNGLGQHVANSVIMSTAGVRSVREAVLDDELTPLRTVRRLVRASANHLTLGVQDLTSLVIGVNSNVVLGSDTQTVIRITIGPAGPFSLTGLCADSSTTVNQAVDGRVLVLLNGTAYAMTLSSASTASLAGNRLLLTSMGMVVRSNGSATLVWDADVGHWRVIGAVL